MEPCPCPVLWALLCSTCCLKVIAIIFRNMSKIPNPINNLIWQHKTGVAIYFHFGRICYVGLDSGRFDAPLATIFVRAWFVLFTLRLSRENMLNIIIWMRKWSLWRRTGACRCVTTAWMHSDHTGAYVAQPYSGAHLFPGPTLIPARPYSWAPQFSAPSRPQLSCVVFGRWLLFCKSDPV